MLHKGRGNFGLARVGEVPQGARARTLEKGKLLQAAGRESKTREGKTMKSLENWREQLFRQRERNGRRNSTLARPLDGDSWSSNSLEAWLSRMTPLLGTLSLTSKKQQPNEREGSHPT